MTGVLMMKFPLYPRRQPIAPLWLPAVIASVALSACGGAPQGTQAAVSDIAVADTTAGPSVFIEYLTLSGNSTIGLTGVGFTIAPKPGSVSKPVNVSYTITALNNRGYVSSSDRTVTLPVFGLYDNYANKVTVQLTFHDGSTRALAVNLQTAAYVDPSGVYARPTILKQRVAGAALGFDFLYVKSGLEGPVVLDTDGAIRWAVPDGYVKSGAISSALQNDEFVIGDPAHPTVYRLRLDGAEEQESPLESSTFTMFHHKIDHGSQALLAEFNTESAGVVNIESTVAEITDSGAVLNEWDLAAIIRDYMTSQGDDASAFVRPGTDWFHNNATTYDASDDSLIVSSRENFVIKLDYHTGAIIWILGDPTKYWYTFPSLRAKALTLNAGALYPIGQHAVSITSDGLLMLFDDGLGSANQPAGAPTGQNRTYSVVSAYSIDAASMTATDVWDFDYGQTIYSPVCGSAYEGSAGSVLVDYATADNYTQARLVGLDSSHNVVFDFEYPTVPCDTSWNSLPIAFDNMSIAN
jgi:arylsulfate sulfotransferase